MRNSFITLLLMLLIPLGLGAQGQGDVWFFGDSVLMDFSLGSPIVRTNTTMTSIEASSSLSDPDGQLLLYTNGFELLKGDSQIFNGWNPPSNYAANRNVAQGTMLLHVNDSIVYHFAYAQGPTSGSHWGIYYAKLNFNANNGQGTVETSHVNIADSVTEQMTAVRDADNKGWWLLSHKTTSDKFIKWHIDKNGTLTKSFQTIGSVHPPLFGNYITPICISNQGDRFALAANRGMIEIFDFDRCTGNISFFNSIQKAVADSNSFFGLSFSPSGNLLYLSDDEYQTETRLYQYNLDSANLLTSEIEIWRETLDPMEREALGHHKLGPDGKIYVIHNSTNPSSRIGDDLGVIEFPDEPGLACGFLPKSFSILPGRARYGLPNIPNYRLGPVMDQIAEAGPDIILCAGDSAQIGLPDTSGTLLFQWSPVTGLSDPNVAQPMASPTIATTYYLQVTDTTVLSICNSTIDSVRIEFSDPILVPPVADAGRDTLICAGETVLLGDSDTSGGGWTYQWTPIGSLNDPNTAQPLASPSSNTLYILHAFRPEITGTCQSDYDSVLVSVYDTSAIPQDAAGLDQTICLGDTVQLGVASTGFDYNWTGNNLINTSVAQPNANPSVSSDYLVALSDPTVEGPCKASLDTVFVTVEQPFVHAAPTDQSFCLGECFMLGVDEQSGFTYSWSPTSGLEDAGKSLTRAQPAASTIYTLSIVNPAMQSPNCRVQEFVVNASADACNYQTFIAVNGDGIAEVLDFGEHAGTVSLQVFDMQGRLVFENADYRNNWNASPLAHGIYVYRVEIQGDCASSFVGKIVVF